MYGASASCKKNIVTLEPRDVFLVEDGFAKRMISSSIDCSFLCIMYFQRKRDLTHFENRTDWVRMP